MTPLTDRHALDAALCFDNRFTAELPADPDLTNRRRQVIGAAYSRVSPTAVAAPVTLAWSTEVAELIGLDAATCESDDFAQVFGGNRVPDGADPFAMVYGGHQFGNWAGQLGDGRAIALGEVIDRRGDGQMLQLKGAGPTPYSRTADGRAVLRSSIREFLCSEAMFHLGVPTTRAFSLVATGDLVVRDMLYDGNPEPEPGAVVCRVAPTFIRFGNFQLPAARGDVEMLRALVEFTMRTYFPAIWEDPAYTTFAAKVEAWFAEVARSTARLVVEWMRVGFVHGVLNTDNMSILGLTIDFGPYGWLESFDPNWTPNTTDAGQRRYRFSAQPQIAGWNLAQLASALAVLTDGTDALQAAMEGYGEAFDVGFASMMTERLGWGAPRDGDAELINALFALLAMTETDYVLFLRNLAHVKFDPTGLIADDDLVAPLIEAYYAPAELTGDVLVATAEWLRKWAQRADDSGMDDAERIAVMNSRNPRFVLRNWLAQEVIDAATAGNTAPISELLDVLRHPYDEQPGREHFAERRPEWARVRVGCSMLSCSS